MLRLILTSVILTMLALPLRAATIGTLVEQCTPFANSGFTLSDGPSGVCLGYFVAAVEMSSGFCELKKDDGGSHWIILSLAADVRPSEHTTAVIQSFLNWAKEHLEHWDESAIVHSARYIRNKFPCNL